MGTPCWWRIRARHAVPLLTRGDEGSLDFYFDSWLRFARWGRCYVAGARIQSKGKMRRSLVLEALPCQPQAGFVQAISSLPNIFMASVSESERLVHFFCRLIL